MKTSVHERGATCPACGDLNDWEAAYCGCGEQMRDLDVSGAKVTPDAKVTPAYGMREPGGFGVRGWRVHCPACGHLGTLRRHYGSVQKDARKHRRSCPAVR
jgi:hypothetical protein